MRLTKLFTLLALMALAAPVCAGGFLIEVDTDGADDGPFTPSPNFSFGGDTTTASTSIVGTAVGLTGGDSLFGGDGANADTYTFSYTPGTDADNFLASPGSLLNGNGDVVTGLTGGDSALYGVYAAWPETTNVSGGLTDFTLSTGLLDFIPVSIDQNIFDGNWVKLGEYFLDSGTTYTLTQESTAATFVSMRSSGAFFQRIPEPTSALLVLAGVAGLGLARRR